MRWKQYFCDCFNLRKCTCMTILVINIWFYPHKRRQHFDIFAFIINLPSICGFALEKYTIFFIYAINLSTISLQKNLTQASVQEPFHWGIFFFTNTLPNYWPHWAVLPIHLCNTVPHKYIQAHYLFATIHKFYYYRNLTSLWWPLSSHFDVVPISLWVCIWFYC